MKTQERNRRKKIAIGLMSGTSADGIDAVILEIGGCGVSTAINQVSFRTFPYPKGFKEFLLKNSNPATASMDEVVRLNMLLGMFFADAAKRIARIGGYDMRKVDFIGSHGQTIRHLPEMITLFGKKLRATLQIGDPSVIAKLTGVTTVGDFRVADVAMGGSGAPLVPYMDYILFRSKFRNRALLNIGGIANITILPKNCRESDVTAFDTGPGNMLIDSLTRKYYRKDCDRNGAIAYTGDILLKLMSDLLTVSYLNVKPPKSTGRELFGSEMAETIGRKYSHAPKPDLIATVTEFTALSIYQAYHKFIRSKIRLDELLVSGGGVHNRYLMEALRKYFEGVDVNPLDDLGFSSDAKEAICFAILANETLAGNSSNILGATGAKKRTGLGKICPP